MRVGLRRHPKVVRIVSALKADRLRVVGALHAVWSVFDEHSTDGILPGYSLEMMDEEIGWPGFSQAMHDIRWLERDDDCGLKLPEFSTHNGQTAKRRAQESERKARERNAGAIDPQSVRTVSASKADKKRTREEKRREEASKEANASLDGFEVVVPTNSKTPPTVSNGVTPGSRIWDAYSEAYARRYRVVPTRNATVNAQLARFATLVPVDEAPDIAAFYVASNERFYVQKKHPTGLLMQDAGKLRTEWATGRHGTATEAAQADQTAATGAVFSKLIAEAEHGK